MNTPKENLRILSNGYWANVFRIKPDTEELIEMLKGMPPFRELRKGELKKLLSIFHYRTYKAGETIFKQGDPGIGLYIIREGEVTIQKETEDGEQIEFATLGKSDFFGEIALIESEIRTATAIAKTSCQLAVIFKPDFEEFSFKNARIGLSIMTGFVKVTIARLTHLNEDYMTLYERLQSKESTHGVELQESNGSN